MCRTYMLEDIRKGIDLATANYLVALGLLNYLEVLGGLISDDGARTDGNFAKSNFDSALDHLPADYKALDGILRVTDASGRKQKGIYAVFRCGLVHEYAPKGQVIVMSTPNSPPVAGKPGLQVEDIGGAKRLVVNNNELFRDFKELIEKIGDWVDHQDPNHYPDVKRVFERLDSYSIEC